MKIVHVLQWLRLGGAESVALQLGIEQRRAGHHVSVVSLDRDGDLGGEFERAGITVRTISRWRSGFDPLIFPLLLDQFIAAGAEVVHAHDPKSLIYSAPVARAVGSAMIYTKHGRDIDPNRSNPLFRFASRCLHKFVAVSEQTAKIAHGVEADPQKLSVVINGVDCDQFSFSQSNRTEVRKELGISADARVVGTVGRLEPVKNHRLLIRAIQPHLRSDVQLVIVGDGSERAAIEHQIRVAGLSAYAHLVGTRRDTGRILSALDIFCMSSLDEGLPLSLLEAMAVGLPVVATSVGGIPDVITAEVGFLVESGDEKALSHAIGELLDDPDTAKSKGQCARSRVVHHYSVAGTSKAYMKLYRAAGVLQ